VTSGSGDGIGDAVSVGAGWVAVGGVGAGVSIWQPDSTISAARSIVVVRCFLIFILLNLTHYSKWILAVG